MLESDSHAHNQRVYRVIFPGREVLCIYYNNYYLFERLFSYYKASDTIRGIYCISDEWLSDIPLEVQPSFQLHDIRVQK